MEKVNQECIQAEPEPLLEDSTSSAEPNVIISELEGADLLKVEVIQSLREPCDRFTYGQKLRDAAQKLDISVRGVQRLIKEWELEGVAGIVRKGRADKGKHRIGEDWEKFILKTYKEGNKGSKRMTAAQVTLRVQAEARRIGDAKPPHYKTVQRVIAPVIEKQTRKKSIRTPGWRGSTLSLATRDGLDLAIEYSNQVWQCDHTPVDVLLVDQHGELLGRPFITTVSDTYSRKLMGFNLGFDAPSSQVVALALRHAILPKHYGPEYKLHHEWEAYGKPQHFYTDGGTDFRSNHLQLIGLNLGFACHLRDRPAEGGIIERPFKTFNQQLFSTLPGYTGSNVKERPKDAEKDACLTLRELEQLIVRFIVDVYNQSLDPRSKNQTRFQRWEAGLIEVPELIEERLLDICLMKAARRTVQRGGYFQFENLIYRGEYLGGYAGETISVRFDPNDITAVLVYRQESGREIFLTRAFAQNLEAEQLSFDEAKAISRHLRAAGKTLSNEAMLQEVTDRDALVLDKGKKNRKERRKEEQKLLREKNKKPKEQVLTDLAELEDTEDQPQIEDDESFDAVEGIDWDELRGEW